MEENSKNIDEYIILAKKNLATGDYSSALFYANYVLGIVPNSQEAIDLARLNNKDVLPTPFSPMMAITLLKLSS